ncbi:NucA/NucB deoxyribonuclease domain-containing protein [Lentzea albidocapillata]|uniref:NucA/NucB deoxyribonuclease domain-containing protein n=1 Tax=Lentzea albidocapillata TaxID=40571 RepID=UPI0015A46E31|nr:hypothetical protein [Lentzea albidocapillata]
MLSIATATAPASGEVSAKQRSAAELAKIAQVPDRMPLPQRDQIRVSNGADCEKPTKDGASACLTVVRPDKSTVAAPPGGEMSTSAIQPMPQFCVDNPFTGWWVNRTSACSISGLRLTTTRTVNGVTTVTGEANMNVYPYAYSSTTLQTIGYQIQLSMHNGWGDARNASVSGGSNLVGACLTRSRQFPSQPLLPLNSFKDGEWYFDTTATAPGAIGHCDPTWEVTFTTSGYAPATANYLTYAFRCDNATGGNPNVGCVVPQYPSALLYFSSSYPALASHVSRAQASGLPGATFDAPLTRSTDAAVEARNRALACGDAPSIDGKTCDEYPLATSRNGLSAGGARRIFDNCGFAPQPGSGPDGASACMITASENNAQGGLNTQFYRSERVLDGDPFRVIVI